MRFDFAYNEKLTKEQIEQIENLVNEKIKENLVVRREIMPLKKAREIGAIGLFNNYDENVSVYLIGDFSIEMCGGPHVENTSELGKFKIIKEEALSSGIRRIKAILI